MNHSNIVDNVAPHIERARNLAYLGHPYTLGETNAIANQGRNGVTNVFGDALWLADYSLWCATNVRISFSFFAPITLLLKSAFRISNASTFTKV